MVASVHVTLTLAENKILGEPYIWFGFLRLPLKKYMILLWKKK
jgi:hypothetical protein